MHNWKRNDGDIQPLDPSDKEKHHMETNFMFEEMIITSIVCFQLVNSHNWNPLSCL